MSPSEHETLSNLPHEERRFEPPAELAADANVKADATTRPTRTGWRSGPSRPSGSPGPSRSTRCSTGANAAVREVVRRRQAQRGVQLRRPARRGRHAATRSRSTGWASPATPARITYAELKDEVCKAANALTELGVADRRPGRDLHADDPRGRRSRCWPAPGIGAPHTVVFGGFSADALAGRIQDCDASVVITADGGYRRGAPSALKPAVDEAASSRSARHVRNVLVVRAPARTSPGTTTATCGGTTSSTAASAEHTAGGVRRRAPALHHVHLRHDRQAQGHPAHHRRLPGRHVVHALGRSSTSSPRPTSTGAPPTSAGSPATPTSSTGRWPTAPPR